MSHGDVVGHDNERVRALGEWLMKFIELAGREEEWWQRRCLLGLCVLREEKLV